MTKAAFWTKAQSLVLFLHHFSFFFHITGLCAARHLAYENQLFPVVYEQSNDIGGTWVYNDKVGSDEHGMPIHSSMYKSLKTNLPKEIMAFPDFPFPEEIESYLHHTQVYDYLKNYAAHFKLENFIHKNWVVKYVTPFKGLFSWPIVFHIIYMTLNWIQKKKKK